MSGIALIRAERERQRKIGHSALSDDDYRESQLVLAAMSYAAVVANPDESAESMDKSGSTADWPWDAEYWRPSADPIRNLVKAGALIAAEIDRLQRLKEL